MATYRVTNLDHPDEFTDFPDMVAGFRPASLLPVPYISQLEAGAKQHHNDCGAAAGLMMLKAYKPEAQITVDEFYDLCNPGPDVFLSASQIMGVLFRFGVPNTWRVGMSLPAMLDTLRAGKPPMVLIKYGVLVRANLTENKSFRAGHFAVVVGMDQNFIYTHDPLYKKKNGEAREYPIDTFLDAWGGFKPEENPNFGAVIPNQSVTTVNQKRAAPVLFRVRVKIATLNIRSGPSLNFEDIGDLHQGDEQDVFKEDNNFGEIGLNRWILLDFTERI